MTNDEILSKMHELHLVLADELKRICEKHDISYFMTTGTLLGAIRHKGFIPWDDDMDFGMKRDDFEKFIIAAKEELDPEKFYLQTDRNDKNYPFNFAKIKLEGTKVIEEFSKGVDYHQGIFIDIFPMDNVFDNKIKSFIQYKLFWFYRTLLWVKLGYGFEEQKKSAAYHIAKLISKLFSVDFLKNQKHKVITSCKNNLSRNVVVSDGAYGLEKETFLRQWLQSITDYEFEDRIFPGLTAYDEYLRYYYDDYMKFPPAEERNHHKLLGVDFGPYR